MPQNCESVNYYVIFFTVWRKHEGRILNIKFVYVCKMVGGFQPWTLNPEPYNLGYIKHKMRSPAVEGHRVEVEVEKKAVAERDDFILTQDCIPYAISYMPGTFLQLRLLSYILSRI